MLRDEGLAELLPACNTVILDEAHQLPDTATLFFGEQVTAGPARRARARRRGRGAHRRRATCPTCPTRRPSSAPAIRKLRLAAGDAPGKFARDVALARPGFADALDALAAALDRLATELGHFAERGEEIAQAARARRRSGAPARALARRRRRDPATRRTTRRRGSAGSTSRRTASSCRRRRCRSRRSCGGRSKAARARGSSPRRRSPSAATSRTTRAQLGPRRDAATGCWDSPFDYATQALLYVPRDLPRAQLAASTPTPWSTRRCRCSRRAAAARSCCSRRCARWRRRASGWRDGASPRDGLDYPLLVQGEGSRSGAARALPRARQRGAARQRELLGRRRRARRRAVARRHRQAAVRAARRSAARGAARAAARRGRQPVHRLPAAAGGDQPEAGRGPADPHRDRPRRADDLRPAADRQALRQAHLAEPAADAAHARGSATWSRSCALAVGSEAPPASAASERQRA